MSWSEVTQRPLCVRKLKQTSSVAKEILAIRTKRLIFLSVPRVFLVDEERREIREKHYKPGSTIELHCIVTDYLPNFKEIFWRHGDQILSQNSERGGIRQVSPSFFMLDKATKNAHYILQFCNKRLEAIFHPSDIIYDSSLLLKEIDSRQCWLLKGDIFHHRPPPPC